MGCKFDAVCKFKGYPACGSEGRGVEEGRAAWLVAARLMRRARTTVAAAAGAGCVQGCFARRGALPGGHTCHVHPRTHADGSAIKQ